MLLNSIEYFSSYNYAHTHYFIIHSFHENHSILVCLNIKNIHRQTPINKFIVQIKKLRKSLQKSIDKNWKCLFAIKHTFWFW